MDFATRRVFAACMSTQSNRRLSKLSFFSGAVFLVSGFCTQIFQTSRVMDVFVSICLWSVPVLLITLVVDVFRKRYWAFVPLIFLVAAVVLFVIALQGFDIPVGG
jgi:hypothetical protein